MNKKFIVGNGFIAKNLKKIQKDIQKSNYIFYAAGISNSLVFSKKELRREINSFLSFYKENRFNKIVYISTACVVDNLRKNSMYAKNKLKIEKLIKKKFKHFLIIRLPEIIGKSRNKNTLINHFYFKILKNKKIIIFKNVTRNILDINDVLKLFKVIIRDKKVKNKTITLSNIIFTKPLEIIKILEKKLKTKARYSIKITKNQNWSLKNKENLKYIKDANISFDRNYLAKAINKYY